MRVAIIERDEKVLEELKKGLKRVDPNYELAGRRQRCEPHGERWPAGRGVHRNEY